MNWLSTAGREIFSLFVDDVPYSLAIIAWIITGTLLLPLLSLGTEIRAGILFLGFALILLISVLLTAKQTHSRSS